MKRRDALSGLVACCAAPMVSVAQQPDKVWRIGVLGALSEAESHAYPTLLRKMLYATGSTQGWQVTFEERSADGRNERLAGLAVELVQLRVDVIVAISTNAASAAMKATSTIPIVFVGAANPVAAGFSDSLARPSRNMTGVSNFAGDLGPKRLELVKLAVPHLARVALLSNPGNPYYASAVPRDRAVAEAIGVHVVAVDWTGVDDINTVISRASQEGAQALLVGGDIYHFGQRKQISNAAIKHRMPAIAPFREYVEAGLLMSYGTDDVEQFRQVAVYVHKIISGAKPIDLPIEQPTKFELVLNARTAKALDLTIPAELLLRANEVLQ